MILTVTAFLSAHIFFLQPTASTACLELFYISGDSQGETIELNDVEGAYGVGYRVSFNEKRFPIPYPTSRYKSNRDQVTKLPCHLEVEADAECRQ